MQKFMPNINNRIIPEQLIDIVTEFIVQLDLEKIYVGFSGGADSTALLILLNRICSDKRIGLTTVHFEHGLRGKSSVKDAKWCKKFCRENNINYLEYSLDVNKNLDKEKNIEAAARKLRIKTWKKIVKSPEKEAIALAHHNGDNIENLFIRLIRGSNCSSLTSLRKTNILYGLKIIRPLLDFNKKDLEDLLTSLGVNWRKDETNKQNNFRRNFIRNKLLPKLYSKIPEAEKGLIKALDVLNLDADYIEKQSLDIYHKDFNKSYIEAGKLLELHSAIRCRVLRYWLENNLNLSFIPDMNFFERLESELENTKGSKKLIPIYGDKFLKLYQDQLSFYVEPKISKEIHWSWKITPEINFLDYTLKTEIFEYNQKLKGEKGVFFDLSLIPETILLRQWEKGDSLVPFNRKSSVKLKKIFVDRKISAEEKMKIPLLCINEKEIIWIAGIKRSNFAPITSDTNKMVNFTFIKSSN